MTTKTLRQTITFKNATPQEVYDALVDSRKHSIFSGAKVKIDPTIGGAFSAYHGYITGTNLELIPDKKIVQTWHASDWPDDHMSTVTFLLSRTKNGTKLVFTHVDIPANDYENIKQGWIDFYWEPMEQFLTKPQKQ